MVWAGIHWKHGKTRSFSSHKARKWIARLIEKCYKVFPWTRRTFKARETWTFQQDGAPSHKAEETQDMIRANCPNLISVDISPQRANREWPPNSPDLNVMDYSIWRILQEEACAKPHQSVEALKKSLVKAWDKIPLGIVQSAIDDFPKRLDMCINAEGAILRGSGLNSFVVVVALMFQKTRR